MLFKLHPFPLPELARVWIAQRVSGGTRCGGVETELLRRFREANRPVSYAFASDLFQLYMKKAGATEAIASWPLTVDSQLESAHQHM